MKEMSVDLSKGYEQMKKHFGEVRQLGFVVRDIGASLDYWIHSLGVGPFFYLDHVDSKGFMYKGTPSPVTVSIALAQAGSLQIEFIQQHNDAPSMYRDFLETGQEGLHHIAYWSEYFDRDLERLLSMGHRVGQSGGVGKDGRFVYFMPDTRTGTIIELSEISGRKGAFFKYIANAAEQWDGSEPIRYTTQSIRGDSKSE